tara:strand:+ start:7158 stop:8351 length:1194 start_codon:yes stop_codon:yes gene_type:complete
MPSKILFLPAGKFQNDAILYAKKMGLFTIAVDGDKNAVGSESADKFYNIDINSKFQILNIAKKYNVNAVLSICSDVSSETVSYLVEELNLHGTNMELAKNFKDKYYYYSLFDNNSIKVPYFFKPNELYNKNLYSQFHIIKPSMGSGSRGVKKVSDLKAFDFKNYSKKYLKKNEEIIVQQYVNGKEITVDGFVLNGKFHLLAYSEEKNDNIKNQNFSYELIFSPSWFNEKHKLQISKNCSKIIELIGYKNGPVHFEFILDEPDFYLIDFSMRGGGFDVFTKIIKLCSGYDILKNYINLSLNLDVEIPSEISYNPVTLNFIYSEKNGVVNNIKEPLIKNYLGKYYFSFLTKLNSVVKIPDSGRDRIAYFICFGDNHEENKKIKEEILKNTLIEVLNEPI